MVLKNVLFGVIFTLLLCSVDSGTALAQSKDLVINPLLTMREQMKAINRECAGRRDEKNCDEARKRLRKKLIELRELCRVNPDDERCGAIMKQKKIRGSRMILFCQENPHARKCVRKRERARRREKMKRKYCALNPDANRCSPRVRRGKGYGTFAHYCKDHKDSFRCKAWRKKVDKDKPKPKPITNSF